jgi:hypothetical protein
MVVGITQIRGDATTHKMAKPAPKSDDGNKLPEWQADPRRPSPLERLSGGPKVNGAMAEQRSDRNWGNQCAPQKLLHLVGCREPKPSPDPAVHAKR